MTQQQPMMASLFTLEFPQSVGVYDSYDEAQKVVDYLADANFPVRNLAIVGTELRSVERVLGRRSWGTAVMTGLQSGLTTGIMVSLLMWFLQPSNSGGMLSLFALGLTMGLVIGLVFALISYGMTRGKRDFNSVSQVIATKYEVLSEHKVVQAARDLVSQMPGFRASAFAPVLAGYAPPPVAAPPAPPQQGVPGQPDQVPPAPEQGFRRPDASGRPDGL